MASSSVMDREMKPETNAKRTKGNKDDLSLVEYLGSDSGYCGYCKKSAKQTGVGKRSHNLNTYRLRVMDYQDMLDTNWRRSGNFCYNPINQSTCCPNYPIICKTLNHALTRSQRKCIESVNSYLITGNSKPNIILNYGFNSERLENQDETTSMPTKSFDELKLSSKAKSRRFIKSCERKVELNGITLDEAIRQVKNKWHRRRKPTLALEDYLYPKVGILEQADDFQNASKHKLAIELVHVDSKRSQELREDEHSVMVRYQREIHKETSKDWDMSRYCDFLVITPLITEPLTNFDYLEDIDQTSDDYDKLALDVEAANVSQYLLVRPPALPTAYGTYHCCYFLDDKLIAVGVLDILPKCITTVYFFYEPKYSFLNLGIYSALVEISIVRHMDRHVATRSLGNPLTDYYLGFYVHECKKMRYKTTFKPSYLLCSRTHLYVPTEICLEKLKDRKYADFSDDNANQSTSNEHAFDLVKLLGIEIEPPVDLPDQELRTYLASLQYNLGPKFTDLLVNGWLVPYAKIIGDKLLTRLCLKLNGIHEHLLARHARLTGSLGHVSNDQSTEQKSN